MYVCLLFIAVLLENFSIFYNEDDTNLTHAVVKDFQQNWLFYDKNASVSEGVHGKAAGNYYNNSNNNYPLCQNWERSVF